MVTYGYGSLTTDLSLWSVNQVKPLPRWSMPGACSKDGFIGGSSWRMCLEKNGRMGLGVYRHTGWWFQTWRLFSIIYGIILPIDFHIFQRGWSTTNQYTSIEYVHGMIMICMILFTGMWWIIMDYTPSGKLT